MLKVYSSSAGSGKTFTLTKEYLKIVLGSTDSLLFKRVLAITFTNDAAAEMKNRVLAGLKSIADGHPSILKEILLRELQIDERELEKRALIIFNLIIQNYGEFSIKTIDSFVNQVVKAFALDLGVPYNYEITFDEMLLLSEAIGALLDQIGLFGQQDLTDLIVDFANEKIENGKSWKILPEELIEFGKNITKPEIASKISLNDGLTIPDVKAIIIKIKKYQKESEDFIKEKAGQGHQMILSKGINAEDFYGKKSSIYTFFEKLSLNPKDFFDHSKKMPNSYVLTTLNDDKWYDEKKCNCKAAIDSIKLDLSKIANSIISFEKEKYFILGYIMADIFKLPLLNRISEEFQKIKFARNEVILNDFNTKILKVVINEPIPFIYERLGEKFDHILIDEFQDTSNIQFFNLLPLIDNSLSKNKFSMLVGDPKQSVYRWRGGNIHLMMDILKKNSEKLKEYDFASEIQFEQIDALIRNVEVENLAYNFRSTQNIIKFNNTVFEYIIRNQKAEFPGIENIYSDYYQKTPESSLAGGCVEINFYTKELDTLEEKTLELVNLNLQKGYKISDIAILCRYNSDSSTIADFLKSQGFEVNSADSLKLNSSPAIRLIISFLEYSLYPESTFKRFELYHFLILTNSQNQSNFYYPEIEILSKNEFDELLAIQLRVDNINKLLEKNYFYIIEKLISSLSLLDKNWCRDYVFAFLDLSLDFFQKKSKITQEFIKYWNQKKESFSIEHNSENAINITSIHKSKGLEYKVVILPTLDWTLSSKSKDSIWLDLKPLGYSELTNDGFSLRAASFPLKSGKILNFEKKLFEEQEELIFTENLNLLYVALTRAVEVLSLGVPISSKSEKSDGVGQFFIDYLKDLNMWTSGKYKYSIYDDLLQNKATSESKELNEKIIENFAIYEGELKLKVSPFIENSDQADKILFGSQIHKALEGLKTQNDFSKVLENLKSKYFDFSAYEKQIEESLNNIVFHPELKFLFEEGVTVKNEVEILSDGQYYRPDRLVEINNSIFVVDYKTGERSEKHKKQLENYKHLLKLMGYKDVNAILIYLQPFDFLYV